MTKKFDLIIYDFDGVLTNNKFYLTQDGIESVQLNRSDGLAISLIKNLGYRQIIFSSEENEVVKKRAEKLKIEVCSGIKNKKDKLESLIASNKLNFDKIIYIGNDINDLEAMRLCGFRVCPYDSHKSIKEISSHVLPINGGEGVVRHLFDIFFNNSK